MKLSLKLIICISGEIQKNVHNYLLLLLCQVLLSSNKIAKLNSYFQAAAAQLAKPLFQ